MSAEKDHFADERATLNSAIEQLGDIGVTLGEFIADNMLGDPNLRGAMTLVSLAEGALRPAWVLLQQAEAALPPAPKLEVVT